MKFLYLVKTSPIREYLISSSLLDSKSDMEIQSAAFSKRNFLDIEQFNKEKVFHKIFDFTDYCEKNSFDSAKVEDLDAELLRYETEYNLPINEIIFADRTIINYSEEHRKRIIVYLIRFAIKICKDENYDAVIGELSSSSDLIFYYLSKSFNYKYIFMWHGRVKDRIEFTDVTGNRHNLLKYYKEFKENGIDEETKEELNKYLNNFYKNFTPDYMKFSDQTKIKSVFRKTYNEKNLTRFKKYIKSYRDDKKFSADQSPQISLKVKKIIRKFQLPFKKIQMRRYYSNIDVNSNFYLLPLHYQPESSTMTFAPYYLNQLAFIENISKAIPGGTYLYVKEHPAMFLQRDSEFYKKLINLPNVKIIHPNININSLIKNSLGVITITNTTGYEAIILDRPVFVFGNVYYQEYDYVFKCHSYSEFKESIRFTYNNWNNYKEKRKDNIEFFVASCLKSLKKGNLNSHIFDKSVLEADNREMIARSILDYYYEK